MEQINLNELPRLDLVLMVEKLIKKYDGEFNKEQLSKKLSRKSNLDSLSLILDFLLYSKKISIDSEGKIGWIYYPQKAKKVLSNKNLFWKKNEASI